MDKNQIELDKYNIDKARDYLDRIKDNKTAVIMAMWSLDGWISKNREMNKEIKKVKKEYQDVLDNLIKQEVKSNECNACN